MQGEFGYIEILKELRDKINERGFSVDDRTGVGTQKIFGRQIRFDLSKEFPLFTHKQVFMRGIFEELMWFLRGQTDNRVLLNRGVNIWTPNLEDVAQKYPERFCGTNLGNMYGMAWRFLPCTPHGMVKIKRKAFVDTYKEKFNERPVMDKVYENPKVRESNLCGKYTTLGKIGEKFVIQFERTGAYKVVNSICKSVKDNFQPSVEGVGYLGDNFNFNNPTHKALHRRWQDMLIRVYNPRVNHQNYKDVSICRAWLNFSNFVEDCYNLWGFQEFVDSGYKYHIDKDYHGAKYYSPETCIFLSPELSVSLNSGGGEDVMYEFENIYFTSRNDLQKYRGLTRKANLPEGVIIHKSCEEFVYRPIIWIDQIGRVLKILKEDPHSRRMVVNAWNPRDIENACLGVCHPMFQFFVEDLDSYDRMELLAKHDKENGIARTADMKTQEEWVKIQDQAGIPKQRLSCQLYQRSADVLLGVPFNIASYALLTHIFALELGMAVGEFVWTGGDIHVYSNQMEGLEEILENRKILEAPQIKIKKRDIIFDYCWEDIEILGYQHQGRVPMPVSV